MKSLQAKALALAAFGARGTGKTAWVKQQIERMRMARLMVWDFKHDPSLADLGTAYTDLGAFIRACSGGRFAARYLVDHGKDMQAQFELFCLAAWAVGDLLMFVDELPEVTKANKAPPAWRRCVNVGREYREGGKVKRLSIIAAGQRPAECDKSFIANCDVVHTGRLGDFADAQKMARSMGVDQQELMNLPDLHWIEKRADAPGVTRGVLSFAKKQPVAAKKVTPKPPRAKAP